MSDDLIPPGYGRLVGRVISAVTVEEGPVPLAGARVTFRPSVLRVTRDGDPTPLVVGSPVECALDEEGFLLGPDGGRGVLLVATDADTRPAGWHWVVRVQVPTVTAYQWQILVPEGVTTDMVAATSDPAASGLPLLEWRGILSEVWDAHSAVMSAVGVVDQDRQRVMAARAGAEQAAGSADTSAATASLHAEQAAGSAEASLDAQLLAVDAKRDAVSAAEAAGVSASDAALASGAAVAARGDAELFAGHADASAGEAAGSAQAAADSALGAAGSASTAEHAAATATQRASAAASSATAAASSATAAQTARDTTLAAAILELRGTGQPGSSTETNTAPVGTYYTDTAGTAGAWRWLKTSAGSGVAQWKVVYGDTGWRDITPADHLLGTSAHVLARRIGGMVDLEVRIDVDKSFTGTNTGVIVPAGLRKTTGRLASSPARNSSNTLWNLGGTLYFATAKADGVLLFFGTISATSTFLFSYTTDNPWPTVLPGTPA